MNNTNQVTTQIEQVKKHFNKRITITSWEAITKYHITRLSDIIFRLRNKGWIITGKWHRNENGKDFYVYTCDRSILNN